MGALNTFDRILYINLDRRTDRREETEKLLASMGVESGRIQRISATEHENGSIGCALSHICALEIIKSCHNLKCLIIEDDLELNHGDTEKLISSIFGIDYDVMMLSGNVLLNYAPSGNVCRIKEAQTTAAYTVNPLFVEKLIECFRESVELLIQGTHPDHAAIDQNWKKLQTESRWYGLSPMPFRQKSGYSDIEQKIVDYGC